MLLATQYLNGQKDALKKIAAAMDIDHAREYVKAKKGERGQDALYAAAGGVGTGALEGIADVSPISGKLMTIPGAAMGYSASKIKHMFDPDSANLYKRDGEYTGRTYGAVAGTGLGAAAGAGLGTLLDSSGWGMGLGGIIGGALGNAAGQDVGDYATERRNSKVIRQAKHEALQESLDLKKKYK